MNTETTELWDIFGPSLRPDQVMSLLRLGLEADDRDEKDRPTPVGWYTSDIIFDGRIARRYELVSTDVRQSESVSVSVNDTGLSEEIDRR